MHETIDPRAPWNNTQTNRLPRELDRLGDAADRIERLASNLSLIGDRFCGPTPTAIGESPSGIVVSYLGNINRMFAAIERAEQITDKLSDLA